MKPEIVWWNFFPSWVSRPLRLVAKGFQSIFFHMGMETVHFDGGGSVRFPQQNLGLVREYFLLIADGISSGSSGQRSRVLLAPGGTRYRTRRTENLVTVNLEHTLVLAGGRGTDSAVTGSVESSGEGQANYLVRLVGNSDQFHQSRAVIDYSNPNIHNVESSSLSPLYRDKAVYISPLLRRTVSLKASNRNTKVIHTMMNLSDPMDRRHSILRRIEMVTGLPVVNLTGIESSNDARLEGISLLVNLHQTEHHQTFEEIRVLPALMAGIVVVSEPSPLMELVPYSNFLTFSSTEDLPQLVSEIMENFDFWWKKTFQHQNFAAVVEKLRADNLVAFSAIRKELSSGNTPL